MDGFCTEIVDGRERYAVVVDVSEAGVRLERPWMGGPTPRLVQLEFEVPGVDEIIWARGEICFDQVRRASTGGLLRTSGVRLAAAAPRDLRLLREYVFDQRRAREAAEAVTYLLGATSYAIG